jgi:hypothetical protein
MPQQAHANLSGDSNRASPNDFRSSPPDHEVNKGPWKCHDGAGSRICAEARRSNGLETALTVSRATGFRLEEEEGSRFCRWLLLAWMSEALSATSKQRVFLGIEGIDEQAKRP